MTKPLPSFHYQPSVECHSERPHVILSESEGSRSPAREMLRCTHYSTFAPFTRLIVNLEFKHLSLLHTRSTHLFIQSIHNRYNHRRLIALPAVRFVHNDSEETLLLIRFLRQAARDLRLGIGSCAVLCPSNDTGKTLAANLTKAGLEATFMEGKNLDLSQKGVKVLTLNSAKGLEFPIVALAGFIGSRYDHFSLAVFDEEQEEDIARSRRVIFVGMTRAMRALLIAVPNGTSSPLLTGFDDRYWNVVEHGG
jgi:hypothetical protein